MRNVNLNVLFIVFILLAGCSNDIVDVDNEELTVEELKLKSGLLGEWIELSPCDSCNMLIFTKNDSILQESLLGHGYLSSSFEIVAKDSIRVKRNWELEEIKKTTTHKIIFHSKDTLEIKWFLPVDYGVFGFEDIKLYKSK